MSHYIAVLMPQSGGGWRAHFPDFIGCRADGLTVEAAITSAGIAASAKAHAIKQAGQSLPAPQTYDEFGTIRMGGRVRAVSIGP